MKKPEEYVPGGIIEVCGDWYEDLLKCVSEAQKEAYNQAIQDVYNDKLLKNDTAFKISFNENFVETILKLKI